MILDLITTEHTAQLQDNMHVWRACVSHTSFFCVAHEFHVNIVTA